MLRFQRHLFLAFSFFFQKGRHVPCIMTSSIIPSLDPSNSQYLEMWEVDSPALWENNQICKRPVIMIIQYPLDYKYRSNVLFRSGLRYLFTRRLQAHPGCSKRDPKWNYKNTWRPLLSSLQYRVSLQCVVCTTLVHVRSKRRFNSHIHLRGGS